MNQWAQYPELEISPRDCEKNIGIILVSLSIGWFKGKIWPETPIEMKSWEILCFPVKIFPWKVNPLVWFADDGMAEIFTSSDRKMAVWINHQDRDFGTFDVSFTLCEVENWPMDHSYAIATIVCYYIVYYSWFTQKNGDFPWQNGRVYQRCYRTSFQVICCSATRSTSQWWCWVKTCTSPTGIVFHDIPWVTEVSSKVSRYLEIINDNQ